MYTQQRGVHKGSHGTYLLQLTLIITVTLSLVKALALQLWSIEALQQRPASASAIACPDYYPSSSQE